MSPLWPIAVNLIPIIEADCLHRLTATTVTDGVISLAFEQRRLERLFTAEADAQVVDDGGRQ